MGGSAIEADSDSVDLIKGGLGDSLRASSGGVVGGFTNRADYRDDGEVEIARVNGHEGRWGLRGRPKGLFGGIWGPHVRVGS
jgi:hypothetical protein